MKRLKLKNRFVMPAMVTCTANSIGEVTQRNVVWTQNFYTDSRDSYPSLEVWQQFNPKTFPQPKGGLLCT
jgi:hypothetical protein